MKFEDLKGKTLTAINQTSDELVFTDNKGKEYKLYHAQDCCESVEIESIVGDLTDLIGNELLIAEEVNHEQDKKTEGFNIGDYQESFTWTFYKLDTIKGGVTIRWYGESNGCYSEEVDFVQIGG